MSILRPTTRAERHVRAGDLYVKQGGSKAVRDAVDKAAARAAAERQAQGRKR